jgi:pimeloyl-[acyl-carrier protein] methyl ester esterase
MPLTLLFLHGWSFDAGFWKTLADLLPEWPAVFDDRGYFGIPATAVVASECLVIAHSFGTLRALAAPPPGCRGIVAINGFDCFANHTPTRIVDRMIARFEADPAQVVADFRRRIRAIPPPGDIDRDRLLADLFALRNEDRSVEASRWPGPLVSLQGAHDPLLPMAGQDRAFAGTPRVLRITEPDAGHLFPITHSEACARVIRTLAEQVA